MTTPVVNRVNPASEIMNPTGVMGKSAVTGPLKQKVGFPCMIKEWLCLRMNLETAVRDKRSKIQKTLQQVSDQLFLAASENSSTAAEWIPIKLQTFMIPRVLNYFEL